MAKVIEFPKPRACEEDTGKATPIDRKKILNIADWTPRCPIQIISVIDAWPFCGA